MSVLVDTSVWADHLRAPEPALVRLLSEQAVGMHRFVLGELAMGNLRERGRLIALLSALPMIAVIDDATWLGFVDRERLGGSGIGYVDAHLLAAAVVNGSLLWTRDRRLAERADALGCGWTA